jgi:hypothetical protein
LPTPRNKTPVAGDGEAIEIILKTMANKEAVFPAAVFLADREVVFLADREVVFLADPAAAFLADREAFPGVGKAVFPAVDSLAVARAKTGWRVSCNNSIPTRTGRSTPTKFNRSVRVPA